MRHRSICFACAHYMFLILLFSTSLHCERLRAQTTTVDPGGLNRGKIDNSLQFGTTELYPPPRGNGPNTSKPTGTAIGSNRTEPLPLEIHSRVAPPNSYGLDFYTGGISRMSITRGGRVGIGTSDPSSTLEVDQSGDADITLDSTDANGGRWKLSSKGGSTDQTSMSFAIIDRRTPNMPRLFIDSYGMVTVDTLKISGGSDLAEPFAISGNLPAQGTVMVIDEEHAGALKISPSSYNQSVAGVVSGAGGVAAGIRMTSLADGQSADIALTGRVYVQAEADDGPIRPGDLLTTSSVPGRCMKAQDLERARGAVLGKAMSALDKGQGLVLVLVNLQ